MKTNTIKSARVPSFDDRLKTYISTEGNEPLTFKKNRLSHPNLQTNPVFTKSSSQINYAPNKRGSKQSQEANSAKHNFDSQKNSAFSSFVNPVRQINLPPDQLYKVDKDDETTNRQMINFRRQRIMAFEDSMTPWAFKTQETRPAFKVKRASGTIDSKEPENENKKRKNPEMEKREEKEKKVKQFYERLDEYKNIIEMGNKKFVEINHGKKASEMIQLKVSPLDLLEKGAMIPAIGKNIQKRVKSAKGVGAYTMRNRSLDRSQKERQSEMDKDRMENKQGPRESENFSQAVSVQIMPCGPGKEYRVSKKNNLLGLKKKYASSFHEPVQERLVFERKNSNEEEGTGIQGNRLDDKENSRLSEKSRLGSKEKLTEKEWDQMQREKANLMLKQETGKVKNEGKTKKVVFSLKNDPKFRGSLSDINLMETRSNLDKEISKNKKRYKELSRNYQKIKEKSSAEFKYKLLMSNKYFCKSMVGDCNDRQSVEQQIRIIKSQKRQEAELENLFKNRDRNRSLVSRPSIHFNLESPMLNTGKPKFLKSSIKRLFTAKESQTSLEADSPNLAKDGIPKTYKIVEMKGVEQFYGQLKSNLENVRAKPGMQFKKLRIEEKKWMEALKSDNVAEALKLLGQFPSLRQFADVNGGTSLHLCARKGAYQTFNRLVLEGFPLSEKDIINRTAKDVARSYGNQDIVSIADFFEMKQNKGEDASEASHEEMVMRLP